MNEFLPLNAAKQIFTVRIFDFFRKIKNTHCEKYLWAASANFVAQGDKISRCMTRILIFPKNQNTRCEKYFMAASAAIKYYGLRTEKLPETGNSNTAPLPKPVTTPENVPEITSPLLGPASVMVTVIS